MYIYTIYLRIIYLGELYIIPLFLGGVGRGNHLSIYFFLKPPFFQCTRQDALCSHLGPSERFGLCSDVWWRLGTLGPWRATWTAQALWMGAKLQVGWEQRVNNAGFHVFLWIFWGERLEKMLLSVELKMMESSREKWIKKHVAFQGAFGGVLVL